MKMFAYLLRYLRAWRRYETAVEELSNLSDRDLADIPNYPFGHPPRFLGP